MPLKPFASRPPVPHRYRPLSALSLLLALPGVALAQQNESGPQLAPVVVSATGYEQELQQAPASITVITREELEEKRVSSLAEALRGVEGVDVDAAAGKTGGLNISIRGMPSDYTLILIDGRRQNTAGNVTPNGFGETQTSFIPPLAAIERIEIIRGPMSTLYGSDAMGGVVNIITRKVAREWTGSVTLETVQQQESEFGDSYASNLYLSGPIVQDKLGVQLRGSIFDRDAAHISYRQEDGGEAVPKFGANPVEARIYTVGGRLTLTPNRDHDIWIDVDRARQRYDNSEGQLGTLGRGGYDKVQRYNRAQYTLAHTARLGWGQLDSSLMRNSTETIGRLIPPGTPGKEPETPRTLEATNVVFDTKLVVPLEAHILTVGGQWWEGEMKDGVVSDTFEQTQWALFVEDEWQVLDRVALTLGGRYDHHDAFGSHFSPRAYLVWSATDSWTVKGGVARGYKTPGLDQLVDGIRGFGRQGTLPLIGNPDLKPETSTNTEIAAIYDNRRGFSFGVTLFYNEFDDKIANGPGVPNCSFAGAPDRPGCIDVGYWPDVDEFSQQVNIDEAVTRGIELSTRIPLAENWSLLATYTYTDSEQKSGENRGQPLTDTPDHIVNAELRWRTTERLTSWLRGEYRSERLRSDETVRAQLGDYKAYTLLHLGGSYRWSERVTFNAAVYNVLNKDFLDYRAYTDANGSTAYSNVYNNNQEGRRLWVSTNITF